MQTEVVVVGAGPTGLLLAGDLARVGVDVVVLDRHPSESPLTRAFAVHARTMEQLDARDVASQLVDVAELVGRLRLLGGMEVNLSRLPTRYPFVTVVPQYQVGRLLEARAVELGARIIRAAEVTAIEQDSEEHGRVRASYRVGGSDDGERVVEGSWLVGADGHHSTVREALGIDFPGASIVRSLVLADVRMTDPPEDVLTVDSTRRGFCFVVPFGDGWYRVITRDPAIDLPDDAPVDFEEIRRTARGVLGTDHGMHDPRWMSRFHSEERQATTYRRGRVLLAGDAAHVHSPAGGMGMNTGLGDAANLAWKLAATQQGWAGPGLLDTYERERYPVGRLVLRMSGGMVRGMAMGNRLAVPTRRLAVRAVLTVPRARRRALGIVSGIDLRYDPPGGSSPDAGRRAEGLPGVDGAALGEALRRGWFTLLARDRAPHQLAAAADIGVQPLAADVPGWVLVRPDGYVADRGRSPDELPTALRRWGLACGP